MFSTGLTAWVSLSLIAVDLFLIEFHVFSFTYESDKWLALSLIAPTELVTVCEFTIFENFPESIPMLRLTLLRPLFISYPMSSFSILSEQLSIIDSLSLCSNNSELKSITVKSCANLDRRD